MKALIISTILSSIMLVAAYGAITVDLCSKQHSAEAMESMKLDCTKPWFLNL